MTATWHGKFNFLNIKKIEVYLFLQLSHTDFFLVLKFESFT